MRDSYFALPVRDVIDHLLQTLPLTREENEDLFHLSWELELLLLDERSPERQWRQAAAKPLSKIVPLIQNTAFEEEMQPDHLRSLVSELAI